MSNIKGSQTWYRNTPQNATFVGWGRLPEYCRGDSSLPWVLHDETLGLWFYSQRPLDFVARSLQTQEA